tara:strand:+ start:2948 stop:3874 length:927 start_codon:yes stop_codon:yes gene_type:complete
MPLPSSPNPISLQDIATEFNDAAPHSMSEFYGVGSPPTPSSGQLSFSDFHGISNYPANTWSHQSDGGVDTNVAYDQQTWSIDFSSDQSNWSVGDMIIATVACDIYPSSPGGAYTNEPWLTPSGWTAISGSTRSGTLTGGNASIFGKILTSSDISGSSTTSVSLQNTVGVYGYVRFHSSWWRFRKTAGVTGHSSISVQSSSAGGSGSTSSTYSIPSIGTFPSHASPLLVGIGRGFSSYSYSNYPDTGNGPWIGKVNYRGMDTLARGYYAGINNSFAASVQSWSSASLPSNITGQLTGETAAWAWIYTTP